MHNHTPVYPPLQAQIAMASSGWLPPGGWGKNPRPYLSNMRVWEPGAGRALFGIAPAPLTQIAPHWCKKGGGGALSDRPITYPVNAMGLLRKLHPPQEGLELRVKQ